MTSRTYYMLGGGGEGDIYRREVNYCSGFSYLIEYADEKLLFLATYYSQWRVKFL